MANTSSTVDKALTLLGFFTERRSAAGLSELARLSGFNKATTLRFLNSLEAKGFVEQDAATRAYHLGPAFLRFAQVRESSFPFARAVRDILHGLVEKTGETAHVSALSGGVLANIDRVESKRSNRVVLDPGEVLPFHATASGIVYLAFADPDVTGAALKAPLTRRDPRPRGPGPRQWIRARRRNLRGSGRRPRPALFRAIRRCLRRGGRRPAQGARQRRRRGADPARVAHRRPETVRRLWRGAAR